MSKIGKKNISIPSSVQVQYSNNIISLKGKNGSIEILIDENIRLNLFDDYISLEPIQSSKAINMKWGLSRALINNAIIGVSEGFKNQLQLIGVGYKVQSKGNDLEFNLGHSHSILFKAIEGISFKVQSNIIEIFGIDKQVVGQVTQSIINLRKRDIYKGKGIYFVGEIIRKKQVKK